MSSKIPDIWRLILSQVLPLLRPEFSKQSKPELTQSSWAKHIKSYCNVPEAYNDFFNPLQAAGCPFPYTILTPSHRRSSYRTSEKLICALDDAIYVLELNEKKPAVQCYPLEGISYVEFWTALLASSFTICGVNGHGVYTSSTLIFNSVTDYLFTPILDSARRVKTDFTLGEGNVTTGPFDHLVKANYKFMKFAERSLLDGEKVLHFILQPEIQEKVLTVFSRSYYKTISPTHMSILTDRELILIREEDTRRKEDRYGGVWDYIPLSKIDFLFLGELDDNLLQLVIQLPGSVRLNCLYQRALKGELDRLVDRFRQITVGHIS